MVFNNLMDGTKEIVEYQFINGIIECVENSLKLNFEKDNMFENIKIDIISYLYNNDNILYSLYALLSDKNGDYQAVRMNDTQDIVDNKNKEKLLIKLYELLGILNDINYNDYIIMKRKMKTIDTCKDFIMFTLKMIYTAYNIDDMLDISDTEEYKLNTYRPLDVQNDVRIWYITDIHITGRLNSDILKDIDYNIRKIVNNSGDIILIGGDITNDFVVFETFIKRLHIAFVNTGKLFPAILFVLGNHELLMYKNIPTDEEWDKKFRSYLGDITKYTGTEKVIQMYKKLLDFYDIFLLQNEMAYLVTNKYDRNYKYKVNIISYDELISLGADEIKDKVLYENNEYNILTVKFFGSMGLYGGNVRCNKALEENEKFKRACEKAMSVFEDDKLVILTHTPMKYDIDWFNSINKDNCIFVFGHTHDENSYIEENNIRIYSDNQIGYSDNCRMKFFDLKLTYNIFEEYKDGIHEISYEDYSKFYRYLNMELVFDKDRCYKLYMLKRQGYYMFVHETENGSYTILNGGQRRRIKINKKVTLQYYYDNMLDVVHNIEGSMHGYTEIQNRVADLVEKFGGEGRIHGCIVDIDFYSHVYINPYDLKITYYYAIDMTQKWYYSSLEKLLKEHNNDLHKKYLEVIKNNIIRVGNTELSTVDENNISYTNTDIYKASNRIAILQKIYNKIITDWVFDENDVIELYNLVMPNLECFKKRYLLLENNMMDEE